MKYPLKVFKFGGASIRHATAIRKVASILQSLGDQRIIIVVSAMGKTTNALERVVKGILAKGDWQAELSSIHAYHREVMKDLFSNNHPVWKLISEVFEQIVKHSAAGYTADQLYDQVVSTGERASSILISEFLQTQGIAIQWVNAAEYIVTDTNYREGNVDWTTSEQRIMELRTLLEKKSILTQGFIGGTSDGLLTTLGREGSDFTAAIFGFCLNAESVTIWKDVPGVMNADPKRIPDAVTFSELPFREAAEMTYYGATVIHPKTIKPLANRGIPLLVRSFEDPSLPGTVIRETKVSRLPPLIVFKENQCLVSCRVTDYTFIDEDQLSHIFQSLSELRLKINVMQNSAISFSFCLDYREDRVQLLIEKLATMFEVFYNTGLTLITIKNYDEATADFYRKKPGLLLEQSSRSTIQVLIREGA